MKKGILSLIFVTALVISGLAGCATVPKETVELSYAMGEDLNAVHASYKILIQQHFASLRGQVTAYFDNKWRPAYLDDFIKAGELAKYAQDSDPVKAYDGVSAWVEVALEEIENKRNQLLAPLNQDEKALLASVDDAFSRLIRANAAITAELNSIRKVQEVQDETLKALNVKDLRDKINKQLISASDKAEKAIQQMETVKKGITSADQKKQELMQKFKGGK